MEAGSDCGKNSGVRVEVRPPTSMTTWRSVPPIFLEAQRPSVGVVGAIAERSSVIAQTLRGKKDAGLAEWAPASGPRSAEE